MGLKLKKDPKEWMKFTAAAAVALGILTILLWRRKIVSQGALTSVLTFLCFALLICLIRPRWFRSFYRIGVTIGFHLGQGVGKIVLAVLFCVVLTPLGLLLRLFGKDLLAMKKNAS